jgi:hypothetical protein
MRSHLRVSVLQKSAALVLCAFGAIAAAACSSNAGPTEATASASSEALSIGPIPIFRSLPWAYGQSGNQSAQTAASPTDQQMFCAGGGGFQNPIQDTSWTARARTTARGRSSV